MTEHCKCPKIYQTNTESILSKKRKPRCIYVDLLCYAK